MFCWDGVCDGKPRTAQSAFCRPRCCLLASRWFTFNCLLSLEGESCKSVGERQGGCFVVAPGGLIRRGFHGCCSSWDFPPWASSVPNRQCPFFTSTARNLSRHLVGTPATPASPWLLSYKNRRVVAFLGGALGSLPSGSPASVCFHLDSLVQMYNPLEHFNPFDNLIFFFL